MIHHHLDWDDRLFKITMSIAFAVGAGILQQILSAVGIDIFKWFRSKKNVSKN
jgi:hypothetical protein